MAWFDSTTTFSPSLRRLCLAASLILNSIACAGSDATTSDRAGLRPQHQEAAKGNLQIEGEAPGRANTISRPINAARIRFALRHGATSFIIHLAAPGQQRCFTIENRNPAAQGRFSIAISNERLAADNPKWRAVGGDVPFRNKRQFDLSLVGVDAEFVKVTFQVDEPGKITRHDELDQTAHRLTAQP